MSELGNIDLDIIMKHKHNPIKKFFRKLKNALGWLPVIWNDEQWDYIFLLNILNFKLGLMEKFFMSDLANGEDSKDIGLNLRHIKNITKKLLENNYLDNALQKFEKVYPEYTWEPKWKKSENNPGYVELINEDTEEQKLLLRKCYEEADFKERRDFDSLGEELKHMNMWWD